MRLLPVYWYYCLIAIGAFADFTYNKCTLYFNSTQDIAVLIRVFFRDNLKKLKTIFAIYFVLSKLFFYVSWHK